MNNKFFLFLISFFIFFASCGSSEYYEPESPRHQIIVLYSPGGLGDNGYNDCILKGIQTFRKNYSEEVDMYQYQPSNLEEAERILSDWLGLPESNVPALFIAASSDYENLAINLTQTSPLTSNKRMLLFESSLKNMTFSTFRISMFGASYLAGISAWQLNCEKVLTVLANSYDLPIACAADGFSMGFKDAGGLFNDIVYLAEDWTGYIASELTYQKMEDWSHNFDFIFPVAGGSNSGIYKFSREYPQSSPILAGMDIDQSNLSSHIAGSVIKEIDKTIYDYIYSWYSTGELPESSFLGLSTGDCLWLPSSGFFEILDPILSVNNITAIQRELEYEAEYN